MQNFAFFFYPPGLASARQVPRPWRRRAVARLAAELGGFASLFGWEGSFKK